MDQNIMTVVRGVLNEQFRYHRGSAPSIVVEAVASFVKAAETVRTGRIERSEPRAFGPGYNKDEPLTTMEDGFKVNLGIALVSDSQSIPLTRLEDLRCAAPFPAFPGSSLSHGLSPKIPAIFTDGNHLANLGKDEARKLLEALQHVAGAELAALQQDFWAAWQEQMLRVAPALDLVRQRIAKKRELAATPQAQERARRKRASVRDEAYSKLFALSDMQQVFGGLSARDVYLIFNALRNHRDQLDRLADFQGRNKVATSAMESEEDMATVLQLASVHAVLES